MPVSTSNVGAEAIDVYAASASEGQPGISLGQIVTILRAYWKLSAAIVLGVLVLVAVVVKLMPRSYSATATLMVSYESKDPLAGNELPLGMLGTFMATQIELMQSSEVLDPVIERLNLTSDIEFATGAKGGPDSVRDWVEARLRKNLEIEPGRAGSQLIYISAASRSADKSAAIANALADVYLEEQTRRMNGPASERAMRYAEELTDLKKKVQAAQDAVTQYRNRTGAVDLDAKADLELDQLNELEHRLLEARNGLRANQARATGRQDVSPSVLGSDTYRGLVSEHNKLTARMAELRTELGPNHPQVTELQSQIDANSASMAALVAKYSTAAESDAHVAASEVASLERAVETQRAKVLESRRFRDEGAKYQLELDSAQSVYKTALDGYDKMLFASTDHLSNVNIISRARPAVKADKPNTIKLMLMGAVLSVLLGLVVPFGLELLNRRVRCRDDLERNIGIPVLAEFRGIDPAPLHN